jgi:hypothetical protein
MALVFLPVDLCANFFRRHSGASRSDEPGI